MDKSVRRPQRFDFACGAAGPVRNAFRAADPLPLDGDGLAPYFYAEIGQRHLWNFLRSHDALAAAGGQRDRVTDAMMARAMRRLAEQNLAGSWWARPAELRDPASHR